MSLDALFFKRAEVYKSLQMLLLKTTLLSLIIPTNVAKLTPYIGKCVLSCLAWFYFLVLSCARVHFCCTPLIIWHSLIVCDVALVLYASSLVQKSLFGWHRSCCFIHCMSLDRSLRTRRISLIKPSVGHITCAAVSASRFSYHAEDAW